jgi:hypothetical protein
MFSGRMNMNMKMTKNIWSRVNFVDSNTLTVL